MALSALQIRLQHSSKMNPWFITHITSAFILSHFLYVSSSPQNRLCGAAWTCAGRFWLFHCRKTSVLGTEVIPRCDIICRILKMWRSLTKDSIPWIFKHVSRHVGICKRSLIHWPSSKDTNLVYQGGFSIALWGKRLKSASEKCIQRGRWEIQQREEAKEIPSRKSTSLLAQMWGPMCKDRQGSGGATGKPQLTASKKILILQPQGTGFCQSERFFALILLQ